MGILIDVLKVHGCILCVYETAILSLADKMHYNYCKLEIEFNLKVWGRLFFILEHIIYKCRCHP